MLEWLRKRFRALFFCAFLIFLLVAIIVRSHTYVDYFEPIVNNSSNLFLSQGEEKKGLPDPITVQSCLKAICAPENLSTKALAVITGQDLSPDSENKIIDYVVQTGDMVSSIAQSFNISADTVAWANSITKTTSLKTGRVLVILPVTGAMHLMESGETLSSVVKTYKGNLTEVIAFNELSSDGKVYVGDIIIIPNGKKPTAQIIYTPKITLPGSYFICPVSACHKTQGLHWYNAVDFSTGQCGSPVFAAAGGTIQRIGKQSTSGNYIRILHPNGVVTFYGHLDSIVVSANQSISQGQVIGYIGHTGYTIPAGALGCHLHFDVRGAKNPFR